MTAAATSKHALLRMAQRGFHADDAELIMVLGTEVPDGFLVLRKDCEAAERKLKQLLDRVRRLNGKRLVVETGCIATAYRVGRRTERRLLRGAEDRELPSGWRGRWSRS